MKQLLSLLLIFAVTLSLCACQGNFGSVDLKEAIKIPEDGVITENTILQIKNENAIAVFTGTSGDLKYEWTVFGSDIRTAGDVNLGVDLTQPAGKALCVTLKQAEAFGFSAALSIHLNEQWDAQSATAYTGDTAFTAVSTTGSEHTILNINLDGTVPSFIISPDPLPQEETTSAPTETEPATTAPTQPEETVPATQNTDPTTAPPEPEQTAASTESSGKDKYLTDPIPEGKPSPVEPEDQNVEKGNSYTCTFSIECSTILNNLEQLDPEKLEMVPSGGTILADTTVTFYEGESVFDVLQRVCLERGIHLESSWTPIYNSAYIEGIHNLYEFDCGALSGWMYRVNGWYPNYGCSRYQLKDGDVVQWRFTCDLGNDIGGAYAVGG